MTTFAGFSDTHLWYKPDQSRTQEEHIRCKSSQYDNASCTTAKTGSQNCRLLLHEISQSVNKHCNLMIVAVCMWLSHTNLSLMVRKEYLLWICVLNENTNALPNMALFCMLLYCIHLMKQWANIDMNVYMNKHHITTLLDYGIVFA